MSSTDDRIVRMHFDNASFKKGAADTSKSLADLDKAVADSGKSTGLLDLSKNMEQVSVTASKMSVITTAALATIAAKATSTALSLAKGLTLDPIRAGFAEYEEGLTKLNTIMNATGLSEQKVSKVLKELNAYSDETIYSFSNMTESITKFVNAGVPLDEAAKSVKGIANAAAFAGASSQDANRAMFAFSQSMSLGYIGLQDWNQIESANMGTIQFKEELLKAAEAAGELTKKGNGWITKSGAFVSATDGWRDGLQEQWATTDVLNSALSKYTDTSTRLGRQATQSATEVRTFTAFMETLKESIGSGWSGIFRALIGDLGEATKFWTGLSEAIGGSVGVIFDWATKTLTVWRNMGGAQKVLQGFKNLLAPFAALLGAIGDAWRKVFPDSGRGAGKGLYALSSGFEAVTRPLQYLADLISGATPIIEAFFRVFRIGGEIIGTVVGNVIDFVTGFIGLADLKAPSSGGFLGFIKDIAAAIGDAVEKVDDLLQKGSSLTSAFGAIDIKLPGLPSIPDMPTMPSLPSFGGGGGAGSVAALSGGVKNLTADVLDLNEASAETTESGLFDWSDVSSLAGKIGGLFSGALDAVKGFLSGISGDDLVHSFNMAIFATMGFQIIRFVRTLNKTFESFMGIGEAFNSIIGDAGSALKSFQTQARAKLILNIAIALLLLAGALFILSRIPAKQLVKALAALSVTAFIMSRAMKSMTESITKMDGAKAGIKMIAISIAIMALAAAMIMLATAFLIFNKVEWQSVLKGVIVMFVAMKTVEKLGQLSAGAHKNLLGGAAAILAVSFAMIALAGALLLFQFVKWESIGKAGVALAGLTLAIAGLSLIPYEGIAKVGLALLAASLGMLAIANALVIFGLVQWESIGKAAVVLLILTAALAALMFVGNPVTITGMVAMAAAMVLLAGAMMILNNVEWASIAKIAVIMAALLLAFTAFMVIVTVFAPILIILSAFAGSIALLALAITGLMLAFGAIFPILAASAGMFAAFATGAAIAFAVFFQTLAAEAPVMKDAFLKILQTMIDGMVEAIPMIIQGAKDMWRALMDALQGGSGGGGGGGAGGASAEMKDTGGSWITTLADAIKKKIPELVKKGAELLISFLKALRSKAADIAEAGVGLIVALLEGVGRKIGDITEAAVDLIIKFAEGIGKGLSRIVNAGIDLIADFLHDLADAIRGGAAKIGSGLTDVLDAMKDVGMDMVNGLIDGVTEMAQDAIDEIGDLAGNMIGKAKDILKIWSPSRVFRDIGKFLVHGLTQGIQKNAASAIVAVASMVSGQIAISEDLINGFIQRLDQKAIAARAKAEGLAAAAKRAQREANKTKTKKDDKAAEKLADDAKKADKEADKAEKKAKAQRKKEQRQETWKNADELERAQIRAADAQRQILAAKEAEKDAAAKRAEANALEKMAKAEGLTRKQRKEFREEAERLRKEARADAKRANDLLADARESAVEAMEWQGKAGKDAAKHFQEQFDAEAKADADAEAFEKLSAAEKAKKRREEAVALQAQAEENLKKAKELAYTDIKAANDLAALALEQAERARELADEADDFAREGGSGQVVSLDPTDAAAAAFNQYADLYDSAIAAAAAGTKIEFNQTNTSPESLSPTEIYRQTNNLVNYAADKLQPSAA